MDFSKIELDVHTHTLASGHAFSTIQEMAKAASEKGLKFLGITEHTPGIPGSCELIYFRNLHVVPRNMYGVNLLLGAEINILSPDGTLDIDSTALEFKDVQLSTHNSTMAIFSGTLGMGDLASDPQLPLALDLD